MDQLVRIATSKALFAIQPNDPGPVRQGYYRWTVPFNYFALEQLERSLGILNANGTCVIADDDDFYAYVQCPPDTIKLSRLVPSHSLTGLEVLLSACQGHAFGLWAQ